jgi:hypothetical protein
MAAAIYFPSSIPSAPSSSSGMRQSNVPRVRRIQPTGMIWLPTDQLTFIEDSVIYNLKAGLARLIYDPTTWPSRSGLPYMSRTIDIKDGGSANSTWHQDANFFTLNTHQMFSREWTTLSNGYKILTSKEEFMSQAMDLRFLLRIISTHPPIRQQLSTRGAGFSLQNLPAILRALDDLYHGQSGSEAQTEEVQRTRVRQCVRVSRAIYAHLSGMDPPPTIELVAGDIADPSTHQAQRAALLRLYAAFDSVLREVIFVYSPPPRNDDSYEKPIKGDARAISFRDTGGDIDSLSIYRGRC